MKRISIIIPTYNEKDHLLKLLNSISAINYPSEYFEVIVVSDGSTDGTPTSVSTFFPEVRIITLENNIGRYEARKKGVNEAIFDNILFVDSRSLIDPNILNVINQTNSKAIKGFVKCGNPCNPFHIFFESIRYKLYPEFYRKRHKPFTINLDNFERYLKGTGVFYVEKNIINAAYEELSTTKMGKISSDDTLLIKTIIKHTPVIYHPDIKIKHFIRENFLENFLHLIYRGSTFVYYYLDPKKRLFWLVIVLPIFGLIGLIAGFMLLSIPWYIFLIILFFLDVIFAFYLGRTLSKAIIIMIMIPICTTAFYLGILRGIFRRILKSA